MASSFAFVNDGTAVMGARARIEAAGSVGAALNNANLSYLLPTPPGYYFNDVLLCEQRNCTSLAPPFGRFPCPVQDACVGRGFAGELLAELPQGPTIGAVPPQCGSSAYFCPGVAQRLVRRRRPQLRRAPAGTRRRRRERVLERRRRPP